MGLSFFLTALLCFAYTQNAEGKRSSYTLKADVKTGNFDIFVDNQIWFSSGEYFLRADGSYHSSIDGSLALVESGSSQGEDSLGPFEKMTWTWKTNSGAVMLTDIWQYEK